VASEPVTVAPSTTSGSTAGVPGVTSMARLSRSLSARDDPLRAPNATRPSYAYIALTKYPSTTATSVPPDGVRYTDTRLPSGACSITTRAPWNWPSSSRNPAGISVSRLNSASFTPLKCSDTWLPLTSPKSCRGSKPTPKLPARFTSSPNCGAGPLLPHTSAFSHAKPIPSPWPVTCPIRRSKRTSARAGVTPGCVLVNATVLVPVTDPDCSLRKLPVGPPATTAGATVLEPAATYGRPSPSKSCDVYPSGFATAVSSTRSRTSTGCVALTRPSTSR
jgi:hypothetical protein